MTDEQLNEWARLADAATPGPWYADGVVRYICVGPDSDRSRFDADNDFIAAAREAVPALGTEVRRLRQLLRDAVHSGALALTPDALLPWNLFDMRQDVRKRVAEAIR